MEHTIVGVDMAKNVTQVHWVDPDSGEIVNKPVKRAVFLEYFANWCLPFVISLHIQNKVLTFHTRACVELMPPIHRLPSGP